MRRLIGRKSPIRTHPTLIQRPRSGWPPSNFGMNATSPETRMMGLPYGEEIMIVGRTMWTQSTRVWRTDRRTDRITITKTVQRRASHGKNSWSTTTPPMLGEKSWWTLVNKQKSYRRTCWPFLSAVLCNPMQFHSPHGSRVRFSGH